LATINIGIDLGTTNSGIAAFINGELTIYKSPISLKETISSAVAYRGDKLFVGDKAKEYVQKDPDNVFVHFKRKMGTDFKYYIKATNQEVDAITLSSIILKELKSTIKDVDTSSVVITIPAAFDTIQSNATKKAGFLAGFDEVILLQEPVAASIAYANKKGVDVHDSKWLIYDLGGGTFDIALVGVQDEELKVLDHEGDNYLGGTDIDRLLLDEVIVPKIIENGGPANLSELLTSKDGNWRKYFYLLNYKAEEIKKELSRNLTAEFEISMDIENEEVDFYFNITRAEFESVIYPVIERTVDLTKKVLDRTNDRSDVKHILLVGGSTYTPLVQEMLKERFSIPISNEVDVVTAVIAGAAFYAGTKVKKAGERKVAGRAVTPTDGGIRLNLAYNKVTSSSNEMILGKLLNCDGIEMKYRIIRTDNAYDSGLTVYTESIKEKLPLLSNVINNFEITIYNSDGNCIQELTQEIVISHGKFSIQGQPLPHDVCIELDSPEDGTTFLEAIFKKNSLLPLKKTIVKNLAKTIRKNSDDSFSVNIMEGNFDEIPEASKLIGRVEILGHQLDRDIIKGTDVDIDFEISESRDLAVKIYVRMSDQEFSDVFNPSVFKIDTKILIKDLRSLKGTLIDKLPKLENAESFEEAALVSKKVGEINQFIDTLENIDDTIDFDEKFKIEIRKRELAAEIGKSYKSSLLSDMISQYIFTKFNSKSYANSELANDQDKEKLEKLLLNEDQLLASGSVTKIKLKKNELETFARNIANRKVNTITDYIMYFEYYKNLNYKDKAEANKHKQTGENALSDQNEMKLISAINGLYFLYSKENPDDKSDVYEVKTGLK
jgi:molecular chaperone DnaK